MSSSERILASLLKAHGINHIVVAESARSSVLDRMLRADEAYHLYDARDERSAAYFALGVALESGTPAAVLCSGLIGTSNALPACAEAFYQNVPLLILGEAKKEDREQIEVNFTAFGRVTRSCTSLAGKPEREQIVAVNRAITDLTLFGTGPCALTYTGADAADAEAEIPAIPALVRGADEKEWEKYRGMLESAPQVVVCIGEDTHADPEKLRAFAAEYGALLLTDGIPASGMPEGGTDVRTLEAGSVTLKDGAVVLMFTDVPTGNPEKAFAPGSGTRVWNIGPGGSFRDRMGALSTVFAMEDDDFLAAFPADGSSPKAAAAAQLSTDGPAAELQAGIGTLLQKTAALYHDGVMMASNAVAACGASRAGWAEDVRRPGGILENSCTGNISLFLGYLAGQGGGGLLLLNEQEFFQDMNALMLRDITQGTRIIVFTCGAAEDEAARYSRQIREWAVSAGFLFAAASGTEEAEKEIDTLISSSEGPRVLHICI